MNLVSAESLFGKSAQKPIQKKAETPYGLLPIGSLITPRRADLAVKYRYFRHLHGGKKDPHAKIVYMWHIVQRSGARFQAGLATDGWKHNEYHYVESANALFENMKAHGFKADEPIPVDPNGEILNGSHRIACAAALGLTKVPVARLDKLAWAPPWDRDWFTQRGMWADDLRRLDSDMEELKRIE